MARVLSQRTRQMMLDLEGIFDPNQPPERLILVDGEGNPINLHIGIPEGGSLGEVLAKISNADFDVDWVPQTGGGGGGLGGEVYEQLTEPPSPGIGAIWIEQEPG